MTRGHTVLVATEYEDATADLVIAELNRRRVPVLRFDPGRDLPATVGLAARLGPDGWEGTLTVRDRTADLAGVRSLYHRRPSPFTPAGGDGQAARFAAGENRRGLGGVPAALPRCRYLSHPQAIARAEYKPAQLTAALDVGLCVPDTLITNNGLEAQAFAAARPTLYKPLHAGPYSVGGEPAGIWAGSVKPHELDDTVDRCAHLFQALVDKVADIRAVVVGREVFCVRITAPPGVVDWRAEYKNLSYEPVGCPQDMRHALLGFLEVFGLTYGAFDFAVSRDGTWWFLECNPNGIPEPAANQRGPGRSVNVRGFGSTTPCVSSHWASSSGRRSGTWPPQTDQSRPPPVWCVSDPFQLRHSRVTPWSSLES